MIKETYSTKDTYNVGYELGSRAKPGQIYCLDGDLGVGKTVFTQGFAKGLGISEMVNSPTFTIVKIYNAKIGCVSHFDLYRVNDSNELIELGFDELISQSRVVIVEWPEIAKDYLVRKKLDITITFDDKMNRVFQIEEKNE